MFVQDIGFDEDNPPVISRSTKYQNFVINFNVYHYKNWQLGLVSYPKFSYLNELYCPNTT